MNFKEGSLLFNLNPIHKLSELEKKLKNYINKAHIYILSTKPFKNKGRDYNYKNIPKIEVKFEKCFGKIRGENI
jgi:hypothetical protein